MDKQRRVKRSTPQSTMHRSALESVRQFLGRHPLPPELKPYQSAIEKFPDPGALLRTLFGLVHAGFSVEQIGAALNRVAAHAQQGAQRCPSCLSWTEDGTTWGYTHRGALHLLTLCPKCAALAATGRPTPTMERNLIAYARGGAA